MTSSSAHLPSAQTLAIGSRLVGLDQPVYVVAEAGVNHNGSRPLALKMVDAAAEAGADAVKFQIFKAKNLVVSGAATAAYQQKAGGSRDQRELLQRLELSHDDLAAIRDHCHQCGIELLATPFGLDELAVLVDLGITAVKLASTDLIYAALVQAAAKTGLPLLLSTGTATAAEISATVERLKAWSALDRTILLHCVSSYPTPLEHANLRAIGRLGEQFNVLAGYSDHTDGDSISALAVAAGAVLLEKHFTLDRSLPGPDQAFSLDPPALTRYITAAHQAQQALGSGRLDPQPCEQQVRQVSRRSVVAARDLPAGTCLRSADLTAKRPAGGLAPVEVEKLIGRTTKVPIAADTPLTWEVVE